MCNAKGYKIDKERMDEDIDFDVDIIKHTESKRINPDRIHVPENYKMKRL